MNRRKFGLLAGTSLATAAVVRPVAAQTATPDATLLTTTLTPLGAERAGNADGSIPAWTGGLVSPPLPSGQDVDVKIFADEAPLYTVNAGNLAQYQQLLTPATQAQITKFGMTLKVYPTHRTGAAPQYVYDNTAQNLSRAQFDPRGGRFGFIRGFGGVPFPIIDTSNPLIGGAQLIWNHLTAWGAYTTTGLFSPSLAVISGKAELVGGTQGKYIYPYYDPDGTAENYDGYFSKSHSQYRAPAVDVGQEQLIWHSSNVNIHPDIVWTLLNGQGRVRKAPDEAFDTPSPVSAGIANVDESTCFYGNPSQYDWTYVGKQEMLVPYNCNAILYSNWDELLGPHFLSPDIVRWEKHRVWIVDANLHPGEHNVNAKRRFYLDEDTWRALLGEGYDAQGEMVKAYMTFNKSIPSLPGLPSVGTTVHNLQTGDYAYSGATNYPPYHVVTYLEPLAPTNFDPEQMSARASF